MTQRSRLRRSARPSILLTLAQTCSVCRLFSDSMKTLKEILYLWGKRWDMPSSFSNRFLFTSAHIKALSFGFIIQSLISVLFILLHSCSLTLSWLLVYQKGMPRAIHVDGNGFKFFLKSEVQLIFSVVLITAVQQSDSVIHVYALFLIF